MKCNEVELKDLKYRTEDFELDSKLNPDELEGKLKADIEHMGLIACSCGVNWSCSVCGFSTGGSCSCDGVMVEPKK